MALRLFTSNRLENLAHRLGKVLEQGLSSVFQPEIIMVQSRGMERWLSMQIATAHGICANYWFPFPNHFLKHLFNLLLPEYDSSRMPEPETMVWDIMELLEESKNEPDFEQLSEYLKDGTEEKRFQLALRIAECFDHYQFYRPEMLIKWERGEEKNWQAILWKEISKRYNGSHYASLWKKLIKILETEKDISRILPQRISVFGISFLPIYHVRIIKALSFHTDVNFFLLSPCREFWGDISSQKEIARRLKTLDPLSLNPEDLHLDTGNSLLASLGRSGREFLQILYSFEPDLEIELYQEPEKTGLISFIQDDILKLRDRTTESDKLHEVDISDRSIQIHSCHSPMREVEVLKNFLLNEFEKDSELKPEDIVVMCPDIDKYSPYIKAVFDIPKDDPTWLPFSISDSSLRSKNMISEPLIKILSLPDSRFEASAIISILESPHIYRRFGLSEGDLELIRQWTVQSGIRWGLDEKYKETFDLPPVEENTWLWGLKRLILGYTMPEDESDPFESTLLYNISGDELGVFESFISFIHTLLETLKQLTKKHSVKKWGEVILQILDDFFYIDQTSQMEIESIRNTLTHLKNIDIETKVGLETIRYYVKRLLTRSYLSHNFLSGGVTFCAMLPMRSIPFKIICLMGMDWYSFPRQDHSPGFDLIRKSPRIGDRSIKNEDKYIFLEAILSARKKLYISYVGQSMTDNTRIPPSSVVSELIDYIKDGFSLSNGKDIEDNIIIYEKQNSYAKEYFSRDDKLINFSKEAFHIAKTLMEPAPYEPPFITETLEQLDESLKEIFIEDLINFYRNPSRYFMKYRLGIDLDEDYEQIKDKEPFYLSGLDSYQVNHEILKKRLSGEKQEYIYTNIKSKGLIPHGIMGKTLIHKSINDVDALINKMREYAENWEEETVDVNLHINEVLIKGQIKNLFGRYHIHLRYSRDNAYDILRAWIIHIILNTYCENITTVLLKINPQQANQGIKEIRFSPPPYSQKILEDLLFKFIEGLKKPIRFFPESSYKYAKLLWDKKSEQEALKKAIQMFSPSDKHWSEGKDIYSRVCFKNTDALNIEFETLSQEIFFPMFRYME